MKNVIRLPRKKQMVLELEVNVIGTSTEKNLLNLEKSRAVQNQSRNNSVANTEGSK